MLFQNEEPSAQLEPATGPSTGLKIERAYSIPGIRLGTSAFTANGWNGMQSRNYLSYYATQFDSVEVDSTFYGTPKASTVNAWYNKTPADFVFAAKVPQTITHEKVLVDCDPEWTEFLTTMDLLGEKLGPLIFQFGFFSGSVFKNAGEFHSRLRPFLQKLPKDHRFVVEIRNKKWLDAKFVDLLREHNVALALTDTSFMPRPWDLEEPLGLITADFTYVRWLGNRKEIEELTTTWDHTILDREPEIEEWVQILKRVVAGHQGVRLCKQPLSGPWTCNCEIVLGNLE